LADSFFTDVVDKALRLNLKTFQCFFVSKATGYHLTMTPHEIKKFVRIRREHFTHVYAHASYWINLALAECSGIETLKHELLVAKRLEFTHLVLHPGCADEMTDSVEALDAFAKNLNTVLKKERDITVLLENTVYGGYSIGGQLADFAQILEKIDCPERVAFCLDTAHAHSFGYDITSVRGQEIFFAELERFIGKEKMALIHLNDTPEKCGSHIDKHEKVGSGVLGSVVLKSIVQHPLLVDVPILMEPPIISEEEEREMLEEVRNW
jgi:deoxyribonuclease-4